MIRKAFLVIFSFLILSTYVSCIIFPGTTSSKSDSVEGVVQGGDNSQSENTPQEESQESQFKPMPGAITAPEVKKLKLHPSPLDNNYMYIMLRFMGISTNRKLWKQEQSVYPRGFVLGYTKVSDNQYGEQFLSGYDKNNNNEPLPGIGYSRESGFNSDGEGAYLTTKFYFGDENMRIKIEDKHNISFSFKNFVIWDDLDDGIGFMGHPAFVRLNSSNPLTVSIPMKEYNTTDFNNIAYITVYFDLDKGTTDNPYPYVAVFDGFEPKNLSQQ